MGNFKSKQTSPVLEAIYDNKTKQWIFEKANVDKKLKEKRTIKLMKLKERLQKKKENDNIQRLKQKKKNDNIQRLKQKKKENDKIEKIMDGMMHDLEEMVLHEKNIVSTLTKGESDWGHYQHPSDTPFIGKKGYVVDLETFWSNKGWSNTHIQEIGACSIGFEKHDFEILCNIDDDFQTLEELKTWIKKHDLNVSKSLGCWKKVLKVENDNDIVNHLISSREWLKNYEIKDYSYNTMKKMKEDYRTKTKKTLVFSLESALLFFVNYFKDNPVWYAHNGNKFDYPILEKALQSKGISYSCVPQPNAPGKSTTSMNSKFRQKFDLPRQANTIECFDTMWMMKQDPRSKYVKQKHGAKRVSQGKRMGYDVVSKNGKQIKKILWENGDKTVNEYSYKLQDIVNDVGMKANDITAHTALADCLTLRECLYRVFTSKTLEDIRTCAKHALEHIQHKKMNKISKRLKF